MITKQNELALAPAKEQEVDGIMMGVLNDGTPYLTARGLARACGVAASVIIELGRDWKDIQNTSRRGKRIAEAIKGHRGEVPDSLFIPAGKKTHAYPDDICISVLEYYAVYGRKEKAIFLYRMLARKTLRDYIYEKLQYMPPVAESWRQIQDRLILNKVPAGFFSVFREIAEVILTAIQNGMVVDQRTIIDISVGMCWSKHWKENGLDQVYRQRVLFPHFYPDYFPQSEGKPDAWVYPLEALGEFRRWLQEVYLPSNFPGYLKRKAQKGQLPHSHVELLAKAVLPSRLEKAG